MDVRKAAVATEKTPSCGKFSSRTPCDGRSDRIKSQQIIQTLTGTNKDLTDWRLKLSDLLSYQVNKRPAKDQSGISKVRTKDNYRKEKDSFCYN